MGKKAHKKADICKTKTSELGIESLLVLNDEHEEGSYTAVHKRYFEKEKCSCPACQSDRTRTSKVVSRRLKDILEVEDEDEDADEDDKVRFKIIDLTFLQRYFRCDGCHNSVFPEEIDFAEKGSRYTNRLADKLADGTFRYSYKKVCDYYGVPASTASIGAIMRRRIQYRESKLPPISTPQTIAIVEVSYYRETYPLILGVRGSQIYCLDILDDCSESTYVTLFRQLDPGKVKHIYIDPSEEAQSAAANCFPAISQSLTQECILRHARNAFIEIIHADGKRFPLVHKDAKLTRNEKFFNKREKSQIEQGMRSRPRLKEAYEHYQKLLEMFEQSWEIEQLSAWIAGLPADLREFADLKDIVELYEPQIQNALRAEEKPPEQYRAVIEGICDAIRDMPHCIFDVLRARCMLTVSNDCIVENSDEKRMGIPVERFIENIKKITDNIKEEREYEL